MFEWESHVHERFGIHWETHTLCKRHAYNLCDAHGGHGIRLASTHVAAGLHIEFATDFARVINTPLELYSRGVSCLRPGLNPHANSVANARAYPFTSMHRPMKSWLEDSSLAAAPGIQKACEVKYKYVDVEGKETYTPGIRTLPGFSLMFPIVHIMCSVNIVKEPQRQ